jgi:hypothetical protein
VNLVESLLFQGNHCVAVKRQNTLPGVYLNSRRANVSANVVDVPALEEAAMLVTGSDLVVSANSVRTGPLRVQGQAGPPAARAIVTSNLCTSISASASILVFALNLP